MNTSVTVVNLIHDPKADTDTPKCWVFPACSWREKLDSFRSDYDALISCPERTNLSTK